MLRWHLPRSCAAISLQRGLKFFQRRLPSRSGAFLTVRKAPFAVQAARGVASSASRGESRQITPPSASLTPPLKKGRLRGFVTLVSPLKKGRLRDSVTLASPQELRSDISLQGGLKFFRRRPLPEAAPFLQLGKPPSRHRPRGGWRAQRAGGSPCKLFSFVCNDRVFYII